MSVKVPSDKIATIKMGLLEQARAPDALTHAGDAYAFFHFKKGG